MASDPRALAMNAPVQPLDVWAAFDGAGRVGDRLFNSSEDGMEKMSAAKYAAGWRVIRVRIVPVEEPHA